MENFLGEIRVFSGNFAPRNWAFCAGQQLSIAANTALFSLIGTTYGGNGVTTFGLPDLRGRIPVGQGQGLGLSNYVIGQYAGTETVTLNATQIPQHNHFAVASQTNANAQTPSATVILATATGTNQEFYTHTVAGKPAPTPVQFSPQAIGFAGQTQPHSNLMPTLALNYIIALAGVYPSRN